MSDKLQQITVEGCVADWEARLVPVEVDADDFGRGMVRCSYAGGFGAAVKMAQKLEQLPADERVAILKRLEDEATQFLMAQNGAEDMPRA